MFWPYFFCCPCTWYVTSVPVWSMTISVVISADYKFGFNVIQLLLQLFCVYIYFVQIVLIDFDYKVWSWGYMKCWVTWSQRRRKIYVRTCMELEVLRSNCLLLWELKYSICVYLLISYACCFKFLITCSLSVSNSSAKTRLCKLWISFKYCH